MPLSSLGCSNCALVLTAALALLLVPAHYLAPGFYSQLDDALVAPPAAPAGAAHSHHRLPILDRLRSHFPPLDLIATMLMLAIGFCTYLCEWIQRKLMERRIVKLNQYLMASVERLRGWDAQQEQLESTLRLVQGAAGEYNLLLFLLLRRRRCPPPAHAPHPAHAPRAPHNCFYDKELGDELAFLPPTLDV